MELTPGTVVDDVACPLLSAVMSVSGCMTAPSLLHDPAPATGWYVNVHNGSTLSPQDQFSPIACGEVKGGVNAVTVPLQQGSGPSQAASGTADLNVNNGQLSVKVTMSGLAPNSAHAAHIPSTSRECRSGPPRDRRARRGSGQALVALGGITRAVGARLEAIMLRMPGPLRPCRRECGSGCGGAKQARRRFGSPPWRRTSGRSIPAGVVAASRTARPAHRSTGSRCARRRRGGGGGR